MASEYADPKAPQSEVASTGHGNETAHVGTYVDQAITKRNVEQDGAVPDPLPARTGNSPGETTVYEPDGTDHDPGEQGAVVPPFSPNSWTTGRDPYKQNGMSTYNRNKADQ